VTIINPAWPEQHHLHQDCGQLLLAILALPTVTGADFSLFFPRKVIFRGIFLGISRENDFLTLFARRILIFTFIFREEIFCGILPQNFAAKKMYEKSTPG
jgi:hypothetical protein